MKKEMISGNRRGKLAGFKFYLIYFVWNDSCKKWNKV